MNANNPNVVVVLVDEWRAQSFGYSGDSNAHTPTIDALATESLNFTQAISGTPVCCPARASLITGQYPQTHGVYVNDVPLRPNAPTIAEVFAEHGYATGYIGKWHLYGSPDGWFERRNNFIPRESRFGFEHWQAGECTHDYNHSVYYDNDDTTPLVWDGYDAFAQTEAAGDFIRGHADSDPFFLMLSFGPPHFPLDSAPEQHRDLYAGRALALRNNVPEDVRERAIADLRGYYAHISAIDECVANVMSAIDDAGIRDNTILVFTSDHGDMLWSQGLEYKLVPWEESIRVPLLVRAPGATAGVRNALFNSPDFMPTLLGFAGLPVPDAVEGTDFSRTDDGPGSALLSVPAAFSTLRWYGIEEYRGVRDARYTYVRTRQGPWLLYDNIDDPLQQRNLIGLASARGVIKRLDDQLDEWLDRIGDPFSSGRDLLERDGLLHYFEVNEPLGYSASPSGDWASTSVGGRNWSIDTPLDLISHDDQARSILLKHAPVLFELPGQSQAQDSIRVVSLLNPGLLSEHELATLDRDLQRLGSRPLRKRDRVADGREMLGPPRTPQEYGSSDIR